LTTNEFFPACVTKRDKVELIFTILSLFGPKLMNRRVWQHNVIGIYR
jgi:hypothetical protein